MTTVKTPTRKNTSDFKVLSQFNRYAFGQALLEHLNTWHAVKDSEACLMAAKTAKGFGLTPLFKSKFYIVYRKKYNPMYNSVGTEIQEGITSFRKGWNAAIKHATEQYKNFTIIGE